MYFAFMLTCIIEFKSLRNVLLFPFSVAVLKFSS